MKSISTVEHLLTTRDGDVAGLVLGNGTIVDVPPGHGETLKVLVKRGDKVRVQGESYTSPRGRLHVHAQKISLPSHRKVEEEQEVAAIEEVTGTVSRFGYNAEGYVNGFRLGDGTVVKTPPHHSDQILAHLHFGDEVRIEGHWGQNAKGTTRFVADQIHIRHHTAEVNSLADTEVLPPVLPLLINRAIALTRHQKSIRRELLSIHRIIERHKTKNRN